MIESKAVYAAIAGVMAELAATGVSKDSRNAQQGYNFRGIDDVMNALAALLAKHDLLILPSYTERTENQWQTAKGGTMFSVVVTGMYDFVSAKDGSLHRVGPFYGEAMDSGDKASNKAQSAAYKYMAIQTFCIPTKDVLDADATTPDPVRPKVPANVDPETGEVLEQPPAPTMDDVIPIIKGSGISGSMLQRRYGSVANCNLEELRDIVKQIKAGASPLEAMGLAEEAAPPTYAQIATKLRKADSAQAIAAALKEAKHLPQQQKAELDKMAEHRANELISTQDVEQ